MISAFWPHLQHSRALSLSLSLPLFIHLKNLKFFAIRINAMKAYILGILIVYKSKRSVIYTQTLEKNVERGHNFKNISGHQMTPEVKGHYY